MVWKLWPWMIMSLVIERSIAPRNDSLKPFTKTATNTISATPIMSAADVTAVRLGFREVFSRASTPAVGEDASHGHSRSRRFHMTKKIVPPIARTTTIPTSVPVEMPPRRIEIRISAVMIAAQT